MDKEKTSSVKEQIILYLKLAFKALDEEVGFYDEIIENTGASNAICWCVESIFLHGMKNSKPSKDFWSIFKKFSHTSSVEAIKKFGQIKSDIGRCRSWLRQAINECCLDSYMSVISQDMPFLARYYNSSAFLLDVEAMNSFMTLIKGLSKHNFQLSCNSTVLNQWNQPPLQLAGIISSKSLKLPQPTKKLNGASSANTSLSESSSAKLPYLPFLPKDLTSYHGTSNGHPGLAKVQSHSAETLNLKFSVSEACIAKSLSNSSSLEMHSVGSSISHPDFGDARQDFYRTVYDISESEEECGTKPFVMKAAEYDDMKFEQVVKHNLDKFVLNYDKKLLEKQKVEEELSRRICLGLPFQVEEFEEVLCSMSLLNDTSSSPKIQENFSDAMKTSDRLLGNSAANLVSLDEKGGRKRLCQMSGVTNPMVVENSNDEEENVDEFVDEIVDVEEADSNKDTSVGDGELITVDKIIESVMGKKIADITKENEEIKRKDFQSKRNCLHEASRKDIDISKEYTSIKYEKGLSSQCFQCKDCSAPIGMFFGKEKTCSYDKCYYCPECLEKDEDVIPSKVVLNWDFRSYKVSKKNHKFLKEMKTTPLINIEELNPSLYDHVPSLNLIKLTRLKLKHLKAYLLSCNLDHVITLHSYIGGLSYYAENIHVYSMEDLLKVPSGQLLRTLEKACRFGTEHVHSCRLCSQKGFYCEICKVGGIIYPFDLDNTVRCESCKAVYHKNCKTSGKACPKCQRRALKNSESSEFSSDLEGRSTYDTQDKINYTYAAVVR